MDAQSFLLLATFMLSFFVRLTAEEDGPLTEGQENLGMFALCLAVLYIFGETMEKRYDFLSFLSGKHWTIRSFVTLVAACAATLIAFGTGWFLAMGFAALGRLLARFARFVWYRTGFGWAMRKLGFVIQKFRYYARRGREEWHAPTVRWTWGW